MGYTRDVVKLTVALPREEYERLRALAESYVVHEQGTHAGILRCALRLLFLVHDACMSGTENVVGVSSGKAQRTRKVLARRENIWLRLAQPGAPIEGGERG